MGPVVLATSIQDRHLDDFDHPLDPSPTPARHTEGPVAQVSTQSTGGLTQASHTSVAPPPTPTLLLSLLTENTKVLKDGGGWWCVCVGVCFPPKL